MALPAVRFIKDLVIICCHGYFAEDVRIETTTCSFLNIATAKRIRRGYLMLPSRVTAAPAASAAGDCIVGKGILLSGHIAAGRASNNKLQKNLKVI